MIGRRVLVWPVLPLMIGTIIVACSDTTEPEFQTEEPVTAQTEWVVTEALPAVALARWDAIKAAGAAVSDVQFENGQFVFTVDRDPLSLGLPVSLNSQDCESGVFLPGTGYVSCDLPTEIEEQKEALENMGYTITDEYYSESEQKFYVIFAVTPTAS